MKGTLSFKELVLSFPAYSLNANILNSKQYNIFLTDVFVRRDTKEIFAKNAFPDITMKTMADHLQDVSHAHVMDTPNFATLKQVKTVDQWNIKKTIFIFEQCLLKLFYHNFRQM